MSESVGEWAINQVPERLPEETKLLELYIIHFKKSFP
jgi:hypothetical protein